jgi:hypothetical protein
MDHFEQHPIRTLETIRDANPRLSSFEFAKYVYRPQSRRDERKTFTVDAQFVSDDWLAKEIASLAPNEELALQSRVKLHDGSYLHIPMIDFIASSADQSLAVGEWVDRAVFLHIDIYATGRSFHGYGLRLLTDQDWQQFMGQLLLANLPGDPPVVDTRWIGHRLVAGYGALRWSRNTNVYRQLPKKLASLRDFYARSLVTNLSEA